MGRLGTVQKRVGEIIFIGTQPRHAVDQQFVRDVGPIDGDLPLRKKGSGGGLVGSKESWAFLCWKGHVIDTTRVSSVGRFREERRAQIGLEEVAAGQLRLPGSVGLVVLEEEEEELVESIFYSFLYYSFLYFYCFCGG